VKRWVNIAGSAFAVLVMGAVLYLYGGDLRSIDFTNPRLLHGLAGAIAIYVGVILIGAFGWKLLLRAFGASPAPWVAERQLLISQIGKYVPGNVAQYLGRAAMAIKSGIPARTVGMALVAETAAILLGGFLAVVVAIAFAPELAAALLRLLPDPSSATWLGMAAAAFLILLLGLAWGFSKRLESLHKVHAGTLLIVVLLYIFALLLLGLSLHQVVGALSTAPAPLSLSVAVFATAWITGLATPGAPGGLGVRETVITLGLAPIIGGASALSVALLHRGASVAGDVISFGLGLLLPKNGAAHSTPNNVLAP
jgi:glycosyltransferase 2 family protein